MFKSIMFAFAAGVLAMSTYADGSLAETRPCYLPPKSSVPCTLTQEFPKPPKAQ